MRYDRGVTHQAALTISIIVKKPQDLIRNFEDSFDKEKSPIHISNL